MQVDLEVKGMWVEANIIENEDGFTVSNVNVYMKNGAVLHSHNVTHKQIIRAYELEYEVSAGKSNWIGNHMDDETLDQYTEDIVFDGNLVDDEVDYYEADTKGETYKDV